MSIRLSNQQKWEIVTLSTKEGKSARHIAVQLSISRNSVSRVLNLHRSTGGVEYQLSSKNAEKFTPQIQQFIIGVATDEKLILLREIKEKVCFFNICTLSMIYYLFYLNKQFRSKRDSNHHSASPKSAPSLQKPD